MRIRSEFRKYNSKLATLVSLLKSGIAGFALWVFVFYIPVIICAIAGVDCTILAIVFGVVAVFSYILFCVFVKADKVDAFMSRKRKIDIPPAAPPIRPQPYQSEEERRHALLMRSFVGSEIASEKKDTEDDKK